MKRRGIYGRRNIGQVRRATMLGNGAGQQIETAVKEKDKKPTAERSK